MNRTGNTVKAILTIPFIALLSTSVFSADEPLYSCEGSDPSFADVQAAGEHVGFEFVE